MAGRPAGAGRRRGPLDDPEQGLVGAGVGPPAALGPAVGAVEGLAGALVGGGGLEALVEGHDHVRPQLLLSPDGHLGGQAALAVDVGAEGDPVLVQARRWARLKTWAAGVSEEGAVPGHEAVQAPQAGHRLRPGAQGEVVGVGQDDLGPQGAAPWGRGLHVACVPTGMKAGVRTGPCGVSKRPARAPVSRSTASTVKLNIRRPLDHSRMARQAAALSPGPARKVGLAGGRTGGPGMELRPGKIGYFQERLITADYPTAGSLRQLLKDGEQMPRLVQHAVDPWPP